MSKQSKRARFSSRARNARWVKVELAAAMARKDEGGDPISLVQTRTQAFLAPRVVVDGPSLAELCDTFSRMQLPDISGATPKSRGVRDE